MTSIDPNTIVYTDAKSIDNAEPTEEICKKLGIPMEYKAYVRIVDFLVDGAYAYTKWHYLCPKDAELKEKVMEAVGHIRGSVVQIARSWADIENDSDDDIGFDLTSSGVSTNSTMSLHHIVSGSITVIGRNTKYPSEMTKEEFSAKYPDQSQFYIQPVVEGTAVFVNRSTTDARGYTLGTARYIDASMSKWNATQTFGQIFTSLCGDDFGSKIYTFNGGTHKFIIRDPRMELINPPEIGELVYCGTVVDNNSVEYLKGMPFSSNPLVPFNGTWPATQTGWIVYDSRKNPIATIYTKDYNAKRALWGDTPNPMMRFSQLYLTNERRAWVQAFGKRYSAVVEEVGRRYIRLIDGLLDATRRSRLNQPPNLIPGLWYVYKNTTIKREDNMESLRAKFGETFRRLYMSGEYDSRAFYKVLMAQQLTLSN